MSIFKCKMCGGTLEIQNNATVVVCEYCGMRQTLPRLDDERRANLYDRANHFRRNNDFDKAAGIYEQILTEDKTDAEAYWSLVLCRYGIEYVEDPTTHKRVPTVNRAQFTSIFDDDNYKSALQYADAEQKTVYEAEAKAINEIQKGILAISQREEPFDVFICYKETDNNGRRTPDSVLEKQLTETEVARREAERTIIQAQAEAEAARMAGLAEAAVMQAKGYTERDVIQAEVQKAYAAGIGELGGSGGGGGGSALGDIASLGVTLGALGGVVGMTKDAMAPMFGAQQPAAPVTPVAAGWNCACGQMGITGNFCSNCGAKRPAPAASAGWNCTCSEMGITGNFCPNCGAKRPAPAVWNCACGETGITGNFCPNCGSKRT